MPLYSLNLVMINKWFSTIRFYVLASSSTVAGEGLLLRLHQHGHESAEIGEE